MRIAVTYDDGQIFQHFGRTEQFKVYDVQDGKVVSAQVCGTGGTGHEALAGLLRGNGVDTLICGGIGQGAVNALTAAGLDLYAGNAGSADEAVEKLLAGTLAKQDLANCGHHDHGAGHACGGHGHGQQQVGGNFGVPFRPGFRG